jgi:hypothetical protein
MFWQNVTSHLLTSFIFQKKLTINAFVAITIQYDECTFLWEDAISLWPGD